MPMSVAGQAAHRGTVAGRTEQKRSLWRGPCGALSRRRSGARPSAVTSEKLGQVTRGQVLWAVTPRRTRRRGRGGTPGAAPPERLRQRIASILLLPSRMPLAT